MSLYVGACTKAINTRATPPAGPRQRPRRAMADATRRHFDGDNGAYLASTYAATQANTVTTVKPVSADQLQEYNTVSAL